MEDLFAQKLLVLKIAEIGLLVLNLALEGVYFAEVKCHVRCQNSPNHLLSHPLVLG